MATITLNALEAAINYWRTLHPSSGEEMRLCPEAAELAKPYALMIVQGLTELDEHELTEKARTAWSQYQINIS